MRVREAKDLLVQQTAEQAAREGVPLSDLEKRMMYFTESGDAVEDPIKLNEEFGAEYEMGPYEKKISLLLHHAYKRVCQESESKKSKWDEAIRRLERGDHYLLVMWGNRPGFHRVDFIGAAIGCLLLAFLYGVKWITRRFELPNPRVLLGILAALIPFLVLCRRSLAKAADWIFDKTLVRLLGGREEKENSD